jgi:hypothetical protein
VGKQVTLKRQVGVRVSSPVANAGRLLASSRLAQWSRMICADSEGLAAMSRAVAAHLLPRQRLKKETGPAEVTRQAGDQGCCGVEVRGFEPLASSVRASWG